MAAPGQMARAVVSEARATGADLAANAKGLAASAIARGQDAASLFALRVDPPPPANDAGPDGTPAAGDVGQPGTDVAPDSPVIDLDVPGEGPPETEDRPQGREA